MTIKNKVYITSTSSVSCAGDTNQTLFDSILMGNTGIKQNAHYFFNATPAIGTLDSKHDFYDALILQCQTVLADSYLEDYKETLLVIGSSVGGMANTENVYMQTQSYATIDPNKHHIQAISNRLQERFSFYDDISFSTACTSSANAIGYAYEVLSKGLYKNVLVVGVDSLSQTTVGGFLTLGVLSSHPCKPFDVHRDGMNVSEAIACLLLETQSTEGCVEVCGVGYSSDAHHMTHPHPEGEGASNSMQRALKKANLPSSAIDYINAHGTGTQANDNTEAKAIVNTFPHSPFVSSTKSITGHTLGAAGALEAIISCMVIKQGVIPPNTFLKEAENDALHLAEKKVDYTVSYVMSNSFAFGGNNCSLIFGRV